MIQRRVSKRRSNAADAGLPPGPAKGVPIGIGPTLVYAPAAQRDLAGLETRFARQILSDLEILQHPPWPPRKVKKLKGTDFWEIKTGDFRSIFWPRGSEVVVLRVVDRRDLLRDLGRIDAAALARWLQDRARGDKA